MGEGAPEGEALEPAVPPAPAEGAAAVAVACALCGTAGALNVPVEEVDFAGAIGGKTSTDNEKVRFSDGCRAPTPTTWRVTSSPRSLRMAMITKYSCG